MCKTACKMHWQINVSNWNDKWKDWSVVFQCGNTDSNATLYMVKME